MLDVGTRAPKLRGVDQEGRALDLDELRSQGPVVVYFYPRDFTPVCTREACFFRDVYEDLKERGVTVIGVSVDEEATHQRFARELRLPYALVADPTGALAEAFDVRRRLLPTTKRVTYVIDREGVVRGAFHYELRARKHVDEVLRCLASLGS